MKSRNTAQFAPLNKLDSGFESAPLKRRKTALPKLITSIIFVVRVIITLILPVLGFSNLAFSEPDTTPPAQSVWSPAKGATLKNSVLTLRFTTDENADCHWSLSDQAYSEMTGDCSGDGTTSQRCDMAGLEEGAETVYTACRDAAGNEDSIESNEHLDFTVSFPAAFPSVADSLNVVKVGAFPGGEPMSIEIQGDYAYVPSQGVLLVFDISNPATPVIAGHLDMENGSARSIFVSGRYAYVMDSNTLRIIDISNPSTPLETGQVDTPDACRVYDDLPRCSVIVSGSYAYVANNTGGMRIIDVSNPSSPFEIGHFDTPGWTLALDISGTYAYLVVKDYGLLIVDISNPAEPFETGRVIFSIAREFSDIDVSGHFAYVSSIDGNIQVDVTDPYAPFSTTSIPGYGYRIKISGNTAFSVNENSFSTIDISDPLNVSYETLFFLRMFIPYGGENLRGISIRDNLAFVIDRYVGLRAIDLTQNGDFYTSTVGSYDTLTFLRFNIDENLFVNNGLAFIGEIGFLSNLGIFRILDVRNPSVPVQAQEQFLDVNGISGSGDYAYLINYPNFTALDISNPAAPVETDVITGFDNDHKGLIVNGNYAYVLDYEGFRIIDVSNPSNMSVVGVYNDIISTEGPLLLNGGYALIEDDNGIDNIINIIDISNPYAPKKAGTMAKVNFIADGRAYFADSIGVKIYDLSNPLVPVQIGYGSYGLEENQILCNVHITVSDGYAYITNEYNGYNCAKNRVLVMDVSNPLTPEMVGYYHTPGTPERIVESDGYIFVDVVGAGLYILKYNEPSHPDHSSPTISDNQTGDDEWHSADPGAVYDVDFNDDGGADLDNVQYSVWSDAGMSVGTGTQIIGWTDIAVNINAASYTDNWSVAFASLSEGINYVSVRAFDNAGNVSAVATDVFYIIKTYETTPPVQSTWSPAKGATLKNSVLTLRFTSDEIADCRWSLADQAYSDMTGDCSGDGTTSQRCDMAGLEEGAETIYTACRDATGNENSIETNEHIDYIVSFPSSTLPVFPGLNFNRAGFLPGGGSNQAVISGDYAYIANDSGLLITNISNPQNPEPTGFYGLPYFAAGISISGPYVYIMTWNCKLFVIDVSNPAMPALTGSLDDSFSCNDLFNIEVSGNYVYAAYGDLLIIDVSDPSNPTKISEFITQGDTLKVAVNNGFVYAASANSEASFIDVSDPASPVEMPLATIPPMYSISSVVASGDYIYTLSTSDGMKIIDVSNPYNPVIKGSISFEPYLYYLSASGKFVYAYDYFKDLVIVDVSNIDAPIGHNYTLQDSRINDIAISGQYAYVSDDTHGIRILDASDPEAPVEVGFPINPTSYTGISISGDYAFVADAFAGLRTLNISSPESITAVGMLETNGSYDVEVLGTTAFLLDNDHNLKSVDISNPLAPYILDSIGAGTGIANEVLAIGSYAYVADDSAGLLIFDISNPSALVEVGNIDTPGTAYDVKVDGNYAYVADRQKGLRIIDVSSPASPFETGHFDTVGDAYGVFVKDNIAYVADCYNGFRIINVESATAPVEIGFLDTDGCAACVEVQGKYAYVADVISGVRMVDVSNPASPVEVGYYDMPGTSWSNIFASGNRLYVADGSIGFYVLNNILADSTPPEVLDNQTGEDFWRSSDTGAVYDVDFVDDGGANLDNVQYSVWSDAGRYTETGTQVIGWTDIADNINATSYADNWSVAFASLSQGINYVSVRAFDNAGNVSAVATDVFYIRKDTSIPSAVPYVRDGTGEDVDTTESTASLSANWAESTDDESGVAGYWYSVGTSAGASDTVGWTDVSTATGVAKTGLTLASGTTYFFSVKAENGAGLFSEVSTSDGILCSPPQPVDVTPPTDVSFIYDGSGADVDTTESTTTLSANWSESTDDDSGVAGYWYSVGTSAGASDTVGWTDVSTATGVAKTGLTLASGTTYFFSVIAENGAGLFSEVSTSDGILCSPPPPVDITPPTDVSFIYDGAGADVDTTESITALSANWAESTDAESGVATYWYAVGTSAGATDVVDWTSANGNLFATQSGLNLLPGKKYFFSVKAENGAGLMSTATSSDGIVSSPPFSVMSDTGDWNAISSCYESASFIPDEYYGTGNTQIVRYENGTVTHLTATGAIAFERGKGYLIVTMNSQQIAPPSAGTSATDSAFTIPLADEGWHNFANPFCSPLEWNSDNITLICGGIPQKLQHLNIYKYSPDDGYKKIMPNSAESILPWTAYWIKTPSANCELIFNNN